MAADGSGIPTLGRRWLPLLLSDGAGHQHAVFIDFTVAAVRRPILSVGCLCRRGHQVRFAGGTCELILAQSLVRIPLRSEDGLFFLPWRRGSPAPGGPGPAGDALVAPVAAHVSGQASAAPGAAPAGDLAPGSSSAASLPPAPPPGLEPPALRPQAALEEDFHCEVQPDGRSLTEVRVACDDGEGSH